MEAQTLVMLTLGVFVLVGLAANLSRRTQPPQVIFVMAEHTPYQGSGTGCLPLLLFLGVVVAAVVFLG